MEDSKQHSASNASWRGEGWDKKEWDKNEWKNQNSSEKKSESSSLKILDAISYLEEMSVIERNTDQKLEKILFTKSKVRDFVIVGSKLGFYLSLILMANVIIHIALYTFSAFSSYEFSMQEKIFFQYIAITIGLLASYYFASWSAKTIQGPFTEKAVKSFYAGWFASLSALGFTMFIVIMEIGKLMNEKKDNFLTLVAENEKMFASIFNNRTEDFVAVYQKIASSMTTLSLQTLMISCVLAMFPIIFFYVKTKVINSNAEKEFEKY